MKKVFIIFLSLLFLLISCENQITNGENEKSDISVKLSLLPAQAKGFNITKALVKVTRNDLELIQYMTITNDSASAIFTDLVVGQYQINIQLFEDSLIIAEGNGVAFIEANQTNTVNIELSFNKGDLQVGVNWGDFPSLGLMAYYPFTGSADDFSGLANDGIVSGSVLSLDRFGNSDQAYSFDGSADYITIPNSSSLQSYDEVTISAWVKLDSFDIAGMRILSHWRSGDDLGYSFMLSTTTSKRFQFYTFFDDLGEKIAISDEEIELDIWYHVVGVYNGEQLSIYVDKVKMPGDLATGSIQNRTGPMYIGQGGAGDFPRYVFRGTIDEVRLYNRALSDTEVFMLYDE